jgi:siroheme synthase (precorrin-2 oxidase/ferrochelatase)
MLSQQAEMRDSIRAFEKYILDSDNKRTRALRKAAEQKRLREQKELIIQNLTKELATLKQKSGSLVVQLGTEDLLSNGSGFLSLSLV